MANRVVDQGVDGLLEEAIRVDLDVAVSRLDRHSAVVEFGGGAVDHVPHPLPLRWMGADALVIAGEGDLPSDRFGSPAGPVQVLGVSRAPGYVPYQSKRAQEHVELVQDIVARYAVQQQELPVRRPKCVRGPAALGHVLGRADDQTGLTIAVALEDEAHGTGA